MNLRRDPCAALEVTSSDGWSWATAEGTAVLTGPGTDPNGPEAQALVDYYRAAAGDHPNWEEYRAVMVAETPLSVRVSCPHTEPGSLPVGLGSRPVYRQGEIASRSSRREAGDHSDCPIRS